MNTTKYEKKRTTKKYRIKSKFRFMVSCLIIIGIFVSGINFITGSYTTLALEKPSYTEVTISYGDTLWDIADEYKSNDTDIRRAVYEICEINNISASDLVPGMVIKIPDKF